MEDLSVTQFAEKYGKNTKKRKKMTTTIFFVFLQP